jgi:hypothetical protein
MYIIGIAERMGFGRIRFRRKSTTIGDYIMAESTTTTTADITLKGTTYYLNGERVVKGTLTRKKGRGKERVAWQGDAYELGLATFQVGACLSSDFTGITWNVTMETATGKTATMTLTEYFAIK